MKTEGVSGNEGNVSTKQKKSRTIQEILETSDKLNNILKSNESREEKNSVVCANCGITTDKVYVCHDCGKQCCDLCSVEVNTLTSGQNDKPEHICDDCWSK